MSRVAFTHASETAQASKGKPARSLRVNKPGDSFEAEADRVADTVSRGGKLRGQSAHWSISRLDMRYIQRDSIDAPAPNPTSGPKPNNYGEGLGKLGEAFLKTDLGKQLTDAAKKQPITKDAEDFAESLPGKIIIGTAAVGAVSALAATHTPLPVQIPSIPLDSIKPGLSVKITYEGPVDHPTKATISFSYTPKSSSGDKKKIKQSATDKQRAENARMTNDLYQFREGLKSPEQRKAEADDAQYALDSWMRRPNALTDGIDVNKYIGTTSGKSLGPQLTTPPLGSPYERKAPTLLDKKLELKPDSDEKKKEEIPVQRQAESSATMSADSADLDAVLRSSGSLLDPATRRSMESRIGFDFSKVCIHADAQAASSAEALGARAYTVGSNVVFGAGRYSPGTVEGNRLLAHELTHVVQQSGEAHSVPHRQQNPSFEAAIFDAGRGQTAASASPAAPSSTATTPSGPAR